MSMPSGVLEAAAACGRRCRGGAAGGVRILGGSSSSGDADFTGDGLSQRRPRQHARGRRARSTAATSPNWKKPGRCRSTATGAFGSYASTPVIANGVIYSQDLESNVAGDRPRKRRRPLDEEVRIADHGPNGVVVADGQVFGATAAEALRPRPENRQGASGQAAELERRDRHGARLSTTAWSTSRPCRQTPAAEYEAGAVGTLWALDAKTGKKLWHFDTVPEEPLGQAEGQLRRRPLVPALLRRQGLVYFGTGNPAPLPGRRRANRGARAGRARTSTPTRWSSSTPKTGKLDWYYQQTPHDLYDWDFQNPPILVKAGGKEVAIGAGKSGCVVAVDAKTGKPVWKRAVGKHNGHDDDGLLRDARRIPRRSRPAKSSPARSAA